MTAISSRVPPPRGRYNRAMPPVRVALVGAGHRGVGYASYALRHPDRMTLVAVADPDPRRREAVARDHGIPPERRFASHRDLVSGGRVADAVINGTMDRDHYATALPLLEAGYHMLLEKPIAPTAREVKDLMAAAERRGLTVMICHVLRYAPFYRAAKDALARGAVGRVIALRTSEHVSYHHMAVGYIRGKWNRLDRSTPMLLAKCCHDLDILAWLMSGVAPVEVASFGGLKEFRPENAPPGSAARCLDGCAIEGSCHFSARKHYVASRWWEFYAWEDAEGKGELDEAARLAHLRKDSPMGRCVWRCDNDVVDHQSVLVRFADGTTATHDMFCATARPTRTLHVVGSHGELEGDLEDGRLVVRTPDPQGAGLGYKEDVVELSVKGDSHGGGDTGLVEDFVCALRGETTSPGRTRIEDSLSGHLIAFAADEAMRQGRVVTL